ncbi:hypothetical protein EDB81DRAFT_923726 [Dactylonectria macrodidyma]|uniref:Uncharacterized protein n=1 Tax=Dactylonectria macrodidyma TaxID=307937 RepID=A0A9P9FFB9_9HYPO|nr:hypothetical protein EDB81DRAFT_923726 [Dactylonectria macrodidyma]
MCHFLQPLDENITYLRKSVIHAGGSLGRDSHLGGQNHLVCDRLRNSEANNFPLMKFLEGPSIVPKAMQSLFQSPMFRFQPRAVPLVAATSLYTIAAPILTTPIAYPIVFPNHILTLRWYSPSTISIPLYYAVAQIRIKVIFHGTHRPGHNPDPFSISLEAVYDSPPSRDTLLDGLSILATQNGLRERVRLRQARLYLTRSAVTPVVVTRVAAAPPADHVVRTIELRDRLPAGEMEAVMEGIRGRLYGAVLVVNVDAREQTEMPLQDGDNEARRQATVIDDSEEAPVRNRDPPAEQLPNGVDELPNGIDAASDSVGPVTD